MSILSNFNSKNKILIVISIILAIVTAITVTIATFAIKNKRTVETMEAQSIEEIKEVSVADVLESNIQFDYDTNPTEEAIELKIKDYDSSFNLYYCIQEIGQESEEEIEKNEEEIENKEYILYKGEPISIEANSVISFKYEKDGIYSQKAYKLEITNIINKGEIEESATKEELEKGKVEEKEKVNSTQPYYIRINYTANCVTIYKKDDAGNYTVPVKAMVCSTGKATPTKGTYKTLNKYVWKQLNGGVWGQYSTRIVGHILFHSVPYASQSHDSLKYVAYDKLGTKASAGGIRLTTADAKWIYDNCGLGTMVEFYSDSNPGPLGKPSARKTANVVECRNWDPTDPAPGNPWRTWSGENSQPQTQPQPKQNTTPANNSNNTATQNTSTNAINTNTVNSNTTSTNTSNTNINTTNTNTNTSVNENTTNNTTNTNVVNQTGE